MAPGTLLLLQEQGVGCQSNGESIFSQVPQTPLQTLRSPTMLHEQNMQQGVAEKPGYETQHTFGIRNLAMSTAGTQNCG